ncbi:hypothetical protein D5018_10385 [Parashewanella curva]|uniref:Uncharacterized protein n=1 Tax=Parashewanella curva TaxID=2338552 RepID=A0A3L8PWE2_9GAMM|nr:hypothetical protein [Parashewanella curva]RLV59767.1 hypothetical protein D5018_10385 [Parashewanella curva]
MATRSVTLYAPLLLSLTSLVTFNAFAIPVSQMKSGNYLAFYQHGLPKDMKLCNQTLNIGNTNNSPININIEYTPEKNMPPCSLSHTDLVCNANGLCAGEESYEQIVVKFIHNNTYQWEDITRGFGGELLLSKSQKPSK